MRIRGAKTELEDASLDTDGMADSVSKLREELLALSGVDIMKNDNTFKSTYDILDELAQKWSDLSDIQQANVTELIAGIAFYPYVQKCA
jgi:phage tail tape measure protein, TP901 family|nr:MAG TPA: minor tail protein [Caudoviricetes sp.]